jgi:hypothetical protein
LIFLLVVAMEAASLRAQGVSLRLETETGATQFRIEQSV